MGPTNKTASVNEPTPTGESDEDVKPVPLPRNFGSVKVHFTARAFPTPNRESQAPEVEKVTRMLRCVALVRSTFWRNMVPPSAGRQELVN
jgi:hypothetical protein